MQNVDNARIRRCSKQPPMQVTHFDNGTTLIVWPDGKIWFGLTAHHQARVGNGK